MNFDGGALGFWIFLAVIIAVTSWSKSRQETEKHETLRRVVEKTGVIDEARLKELFKAAPTTDWSSYSKPGDGYRGLRVAGTIVLFIAAGLVAFSQVISHTRAGGTDVPVIFLSIASLVAMLGAGLFFSSRFLQPPPRDSSRNEPPAR